MEFHYFGDHGFTKDPELALFYAKKGAILGNPWCQNLLGTMYEFGQGVGQSRFSATYWYEEAAKQGDARAQSNLGLIIRSISPHREDLVKAYAWLTLAAKQRKSPRSSRWKASPHHHSGGKAVADQMISEIEASLSKKDAP